MCGRFVGFRTLAELESFFPIDRTDCEVAANFNVAPSQEVLAIVRREGANVLEKLHWGLVPFWAKDPSIGNRLINARSETVAQKPSFRSAFKSRRCLILADGFYEWTGPKGNRQPVYLTLPDEVPFAFAGLWEAWDDKGRADEVQLDPEGGHEDEGVQLAQQAHPRTGGDEHRRQLEQPVRGDEAQEHLPTAVGDHQAADPLGPGKNKCTKTGKEQQYRLDISRHDPVNQDAERQLEGGKRD